MEYRISKSSKCVLCLLFRHLHFTIRRTSFKWGLVWWGEESHKADCDSTHSLETSTALLKSATLQLTHRHMCEVTVIVYHWILWSFYYAALFWRYVMWLYVFIFNSFLLIGFSLTDYSMIVSTDYKSNNLCSNSCSSACYCLWDFIG